MLTEQLYYLTLFTLCLGIVSALILRRKESIANYIAHGMAALGSTLAILCAIFVFREGSVSFSLFTWLHIGTATVRIDYLAAFFLLIVGLIGCIASIYAIGYCKEFYRQRFRLLTVCFNAFLLTMVLVFTVSHVVAFLIAWEAMTIFSFLLVNHEWKKQSNRRAAYIYLIMTHIGTAFIFAAFLLLATSAGSFEFEVLRQANISDNVRNIVFLFALLGFGTKAGIIPVHVWLPLAHPAAPSHVSALMSGVMIKSAIYGLSRFLLEFLPAGPVWWGQLIMVLAIVSCVLGVLYALMEHDLKRLLAYSSVENIGIILLGIGAGLTFMTTGQTLLAGLAWAAAFLHTLNHAVFKSLLFLGAGAVVQTTHTKDIEKLGGLIKTMPYTAVTFFIASAAISALPPFNGFVSEWLTFQALLYLPHAVHGISGKLLGAILVALLGLTGALAAACFVKAFGTVFLAKPRSLAAEKSQETPWIMLAPMSILALLCVGLGVGSQPVLKILQAVLTGYPGIDTSMLFVGHWAGMTVQAGEAKSFMGIPVIIGALLVGIIGAVILVSLKGRSRYRIGETWTCGIYPTARMEYTATGFSKPIRMAFKGILRPQRQKVVDIANNSYYGRHLVYHLNINYVLNDKLYRPVNAWVILAATYIRKMQNGSLQLYIGYILAVTVVAMIWSLR